MRLEGRPYPKQGQHPNLRPSSLQARKEPDARNKATTFSKACRSPYTWSYSIKLLKKVCP